MLSKRTVEECDAMLAQGGICVLLDETDYDAFFEDTMKAGHYENRVESVDIMIRSSRSVINSLIDYGVEFERTNDGKLAYTREAAHSRPRICFHKDITGKELEVRLDEVGITVNKNAIPFDPQMILKCGLKSKCNLNIGPIPFISIEFIRNICISSIQRPHHITSSYTYQFFEKSYFVSCAG